MKKNHVMVDVVVEISADVIDPEGKLFFEIFFMSRIYIFSRDRRQRSGSPVGRDRRRGGTRSRSPASRSPVPRR